MAERKKEQAVATAAKRAAADAQKVKANPFTISPKKSGTKFNPLVMIPAKDTIKTGLAKTFPAAQKQAAAGGKVPDGDILRQPPENAGIAGLEKSGYNKNDTQDAKGAMKEYLEKTGKQLLLGNYTDDVTLLGTLGQIGLGLANLDLPMDVRDLTYDLTHWKWTPGHVGQTLLDVAGFLPVVGSVKYLDEAGTLVRNAARNADEAGEILSGAARGGEKALTGGAWDAGKVITEIKYKPSSGAIIKANPDKTTTILGNFDKDMKNIVDEMGNVKSTYYGAKKGGFNVLNAPDDMYKNADQFWNEVNVKWLDEAIARGDDFILATKPTNDVIWKIDPISRTKTLKGFGRELQRMIDRGYSYDPLTNMMVRK